MKQDNILDQALQSRGSCLFDRATVGVLFADRKRQELYANHSFRKLFPYDSADESRNRFWALVDEHDEGGGVREAVNCIRSVEIDGVEHHIVYTISRLDENIFMTVVQEITRILLELRQLHDEVQELREMVQSVIGGEEFIPVCAVCKKVRLSDGAWVAMQEAETRILRKGFSHGYCPNCAGQLMQQMHALRDGHPKAAEGESAYPDPGPDGAPHHDSAPHHDGAPPRPRRDSTDYDQDA